ncbi:NAD(P)-binding protein [Trichodelitschia bisporula]|uniref:NAD(P)-binding protein n=1 Tax=Trichodelitschia bisporula TaxID=703511 RepID=A0A6G1HTH4_9PEZI|nr:NAD(P)-binding protein [Trichodelitschia bisporula]
MAPAEQKVAIVTGASSGMGEALARNLVQADWLVALADLQRNEALEAELGASAAFFQTNVASYESQAKTFSAVWAKWGRIDALCANAGIVDRSSIYVFGHKGKDEVPPAPDLSCTDVDWKGVVYGTQLAVHFMRKNKTPGGKIVCTASVSAIYPHETYPEYAGAKAAVLNFVRGSGRVLRIKENIRINVVLPGIVHTKIIPPEMVAAVQPEFLTPVESIVRAYRTFLDDDTGLSGEAIECSVNEHIFVPRPEYLNGAASKRACTVWDPLFKMYHGEGSELPDAIP